MLCYVLVTVVVMHSLDKAKLVALLCSRNCGRYAFTAQGYVRCFVIFYEFCLSCIHKTLYVN
jgi:hypothetical protein